MQLYDYWRSTAAYRVRIALNLKGIDAEQIPVDLRAGSQRHPDYLGRNPQGMVPLLVEGELAVGQSLAIIEYLEETHPEPPLLPKDPADRARVRAIAQAVAADLHPLNNLRVLLYLEAELGCSQGQRMAWYYHWLTLGFGAIEQLLAGKSGDYCLGDQPTIADVCLIPQVYNAKRYEFDLGPYPAIRMVNDHCQAIPAFAKAAPQHQPGA
jgi:maleylpyruvate isomerase